LQEVVLVPKVVDGDGRIVFFDVNQSISHFAEVLIACIKSYGLKKLLTVRLIVAGFDFPQMRV